MQTEINSASWFFDRNKSKEPFINEKTNEIETGTKIIPNYSGTGYPCILRFDEDGLLSCEDAPAVQCFGHEEWWLHGKLHRVNGSAVIAFNQSVKEYYINGEPAQYQ